MVKRPPKDPKFQSLRRDGALNPHPDRVSDALFVESEFFDRRDLVQVKYEMLRRVRVDERPISEVATTFGFSRPSVYQAQSAFARDGLPGLVPRKRGPKEGHKLTAEILEFVRQARHENRSLRPVELARQVKERFNVTVHPRSIGRGLRRSQKKTSKQKG